MCIVALAWQVLEQMPMCVLSNRDEFYTRATQPLHVWKNSPIIAGQDLQSGGTWMGVSRKGRWAVLTNIRNAYDQVTYTTSRGRLITDFLSSDLTPIRFAQQLVTHQNAFAGFNLLMGDVQQAVYMSNRGEAPQILPAGVYLVSNGLMSEHWEKVAHLRTRFTQEFLPMLASRAPMHAVEQAAWNILQDPRQVPRELLPSTGLPIEQEEWLSSTFIQSPHYGTRCSNLLMMNATHFNWSEKAQQGLQQGHIQHISMDLL